MRVQINLPERLDLSRLTAEMETALEQTLMGASKIIENDAKASIATGPKSGRIYTTYWRTNRRTMLPFPTAEQRVPHRASAPGEAPATDTGRLIGSIFGGARKLNAWVEVRSHYGRWLEFGTRRIQARPFLIPAVERNRARITAMLQAAISTGASRFARKAGR